MRLLEINSVCGIRSTGRIATEIAEKYIQEGHEAVIAYGREDVPEQYAKISKRISSKIFIKINAAESRIFDNDGFTAKRSTQKFLKWADQYNPDLLWLHNLHGYYINVKLLFDWIKSRPQMEVRWTLHDCWAFTGHCSYFTFAKCDKWRTHCKECIQKEEYPASLVFDRSFQNYERKKACFTGVSRMTLITPSQWLADLVKESYLQAYPVEVKHNSINKSVFKPTESDVRKKLGIQDKKMILGVAAQWQPSKGYDDYIQLSKKLPDQFVIVMVGLTEEQMKEIPSSIIGIKNTNNAKELAELYTAADVFVNLTHEDNYPTVNLESIACGTPVITYNAGGSPESAEENGFVVEVGDIPGVIEKIQYVCGLKS